MAGQWCADRSEHTHLFLQYQEATFEEEYAEDEQYVEEGEEELPVEE